MYPFRCQDCGHEQDFFIAMSQMRPNLIKFCTKCNQGTMLRYYTVPADHSENTFRPFYDDHLSDGADPVYVKSRRQWHQLMKEQGVQPGEPGCLKDAARAREARKAKANEATCKEVSERCDKAFDQAFGAMYGGAM